jgi:hypothetical protein
MTRSVRLVTEWRDDIGVGVQGPRRPGHLLTLFLRNGHVAYRVSRGRGRLLFELVLKSLGYEIEFRTLQ